MKRNELTPYELRSLRKLIDERIGWMDVYLGLDYTYDNFRGLKKFWRTVRAKLK